MELKTIGLTKKVRLQNRRRQFEYYPDQWCLRLAGRKRRRKNNAYAAALQYPNAYFRKNHAEWQEHC